MSRELRCPEGFHCIQSLLKNDDGCLTYFSPFTFCLDAVKVALYLHDRNLGHFSASQICGCPVCIQILHGKSTRHALYHKIFMYSNLNFIFTYHFTPTHTCTQFHNLLLRPSRICLYSMLLPYSSPGYLLSHGQNTPL